MPKMLAAALLLVWPFWPAIADEADAPARPDASSRATLETVQSESTYDGRSISPAVQRLRDALAPLITDAQQRYDIPALSLVLVRGEETLWAEGFGLADPQRGVAATPHTLYRAGSLAKPLTALAVLQLAEQDELDLDQPLSAALPGFRLRRRFDDVAHPITVRSALSHHAGLPSDLHQGLWSDAPFTQVRDRLQDEYASCPPNLVFSYSNLGYSLLGHLIQSVSGKPYVDYMDEQLLTPLGMRASSLAVGAVGMKPPADAGSVLAAGHRDGRRFDPLPLRDVPAQGLITSATDLGRLISALLCGGELDGRQVLQPAVIETAFEPQNANVALDMDIVTGLGFFLEDNSIPGAGRVVRHSGNTLAYTAELVLLPEQGLGLAALASAGQAGTVLKQLATAVLSQTLKSLPDPPPADLFIAETAPRYASGTQIASTGRYATELGLIAVDAKQEELCACMTGERAKLVAHPDGWLIPATGHIENASTTLRRLSRLRLQMRRISGRDVLVAQTNDGEALIGEKLPPGAPPPSWLERLGRWRVLNPDPGFPVEDLTLKLTDGQLCLSYRMPVLSAQRVQLPVLATNDHAAIISGLGRNRGDTLRIVAHEHGPRLRWSGYVAERVARPRPAALTKADHDDAH